jgi:hypothetical protein
MLSTFIDNLQCSSFDELKIKLLDSYNVIIKEDDNLCIIYEKTEESKKLGFPFRNCIIDKKTLKIVASQFENIIYNDDAILELKKLSLEEWNKCNIQESIEGTLIIVFYRYDKWYITTRRCLDAGKSFWIKDNSYKNLFVDALGEKNIENFDKRYVYYFVFVSYQNKNIVDYTKRFGEKYKKIIHIGTYDENLNELEIDIGIEKPTYFKFSCLDELEVVLISKSNEDIQNKEITTEGYVIGKNYKLQTKIYEKIAKIKPNNNNIQQAYLIMYQHNDLTQYITYMKEDKNIIKRVNNSMKIMCSELLSLYHTTRNKKLPELYGLLEFNYKKALYEIHGIYLKQKQPINIHDIYYYLKNIEAKQLILMFHERMNLIDKVDIFNKDNIHIKIQTNLMFPN